ncbi:MAG: alpha/beta hydrolase [Chloroflexi bacterium]|jgi:pimeloyl-ACP methyl ester carboxylesterase|nr:alpha/beta hydrolase [Chloroflexota bacterium]
MSFPYFTETLTLDAAARATLPGEFVQLSAGFTHYELSGPADAPLVVLVHGFSVPYFIWQPTFEFLTQSGYRVLRYDLYGRGYSDRPRTCYDLDLFDRQLLELIDALELRTPFRLIGLSMGGVIAANFLRRHKECLSKLILVDPAGFPMPRTWYFNLILLPGMGELFFGLLGDGMLLKSMASDFYDPQQIEHFNARYRPQMRYQGFKRALLSTLRAEMLTNQSAVYRAVGQMDTPVQLIWGKQDTTVPYKFSADLMQMIPRAVFHTIEDAGHIPHYERPEEVNPLMIEFLQSCHS